MKKILKIYISIVIFMLLDVNICTIVKLEKALFLYCNNSKEKS
jgi:hypothetical protein